MGSIKGELEQQRHVLASAIQESMGTTRDADQRREMFKDPYGSASLTHDDEVAAAVVERRARQLDEVNRALEDIDAGRYGVCRDCGEDIAPARLKVMPFAIRCVGCQGAHEAARRAA